jgi:hypothetical protein
MHAIALFWTMQLVVFTSMVVVLLSLPLVSLADEEVDDRKWNIGRQALQNHLVRAKYANTLEPHRKQFVMRRSSNNGLLSCDKDEIGGRSLDRLPKIIGGSFVNLTDDRYPYFASLDLGACGGALISPSFVVTAAHVSQKLAYLPTAGGMIARTGCTKLLPTTN